MCERIVIADKIEVIEKDFNVTFKGIFEPNYNLSPGQQGLVITDEKPNELQSYTYGLTPFWAKKRMCLFNARSEGDNNKDDDPNYTGAKGIILKPTFRKPIRSQRCLVVVSAFIEGSTKEGLDKPYLVYLKKRPFAMAGIWDKWKDPENGEIISSFAIITTTANGLLQKIQHHRMPVILSENQWHKWLHKDENLGTITGMLDKYLEELMNVYPINPDIKNPINNNKELLNPIGEHLNPEFEIKVIRAVQTHSWGHKKKRGNTEVDKETMEEKNKRH